MGHAFRLAGTDHELWLARRGGAYELHVGDACVPATLSARGVHVHDLTVGDTTELVVIAQHGDDVHIHLAGETYLLRYTPSLERFAGQADDTGEAVTRAPMPGTVIALSVQAGAAVRRGQALMVIESMKMETTIVAPCDGTVQTLHAAVGQTFERDVLLVTLERAEAAA